MNENIIILAEKAGLDDPATPLREWHNPELELFAKLLIGECLSKVNEAIVSRQTNRYYPDIDGKSIKAHFGFE